MSDHTLGGFDGEAPAEEGNVRTDGEVTTDDEPSRGLAETLLLESRGAR